MFLNLDDFSNLNSNFSNSLDMINLQEQVKKAFCFKKLFWTFTVWINCSSCLKNFANSRLSAITTNFFLTAGQNNFANKIPVLISKNFLNGKAIGFLPRDYQYHTPYLYLSMTQLLSHTFAHLTGSSFRLKTKLLPIKNILGVKYNWVNSVKKWPSFYKIKCFKNYSCQKMSITEKLLLNWYFSMKKKFRKIRTIFDVENWLWKSEFCNFQQLLRKFTQDLKNFYWAVV